MRSTTVVDICLGLDFLQEGDAPRFEYVSGDLRQDSRGQEEIGNCDLKIVGVTPAS